MPMKPMTRKERKAWNALADRRNYEKQIKEKQEILQRIDRLDFLIEEIRKTIREKND